VPAPCRGERSSVTNKPSADATVSPQFTQVLITSMWIFFFKNINCTNQNSQKMVSLLKFTKIALVLLVQWVFKPSRALNGRLGGWFFFFLTER
jgi:hypothetical protein